MCFHFRIISGKKHIEFLTTFEVDTRQPDEPSSEMSSISLERVQSVMSLPRVRQSQKQNQCQDNVIINQMLHRCSQEKKKRLAY